MCRSIETAFIILHFALKEPDFRVILWSGLKQQFSRLSKGFFQSLYVIIFRGGFRLFVKIVMVLGLFPQLPGGFLGFLI